ncbi:DUF4760 domain-containing protein [Actinotalea sp. M2MS4P-6]|uniref:DUF4760 domain-containing protein n=1 Tax=Actinotalea sp. M2MS4P-6 TaxID=2983762 RepID=UPI0021E501AC|nr:DUF4760 domain-containing protein [Actinotalea sp. M2MS4P-6]MCV2393285.1 DUF4760 domain-containing protein [Actinotalea sp. M2MS4P-6]
MATHDDATLMVELLAWHTASGGMEASMELMSPDFDSTSAVVADRSVFVMLMMGETIGTFVKQGVLDAGLVYDLWAPGLMWDRVGPAALKQRNEFGVPALWENFEALAAGKL